MTPDTSWSGYLKIFPHFGHKINEFLKAGSTALLKLEQEYVDHSDKVMKASSSFEKCIGKEKWIEWSKLHLVHRVGYRKGKFTLL